MSKSEKIFPINSIGGRIQKCRLDKGYSRVTLYEKIFPELSDISKDSKYKNVYNWESGANCPDYETLSKLCDILECDADYLLGRIAHTKHNTQIACNLTGLSEKAIAILQQPCIDVCIDPFANPKETYISTYSDMLEDILIQYPELLTNIHEIITQNKNFKTDIQFLCLKLAFKLFMYVDKRKKISILHNTEIYNFALSFIQKKLLYMEDVISGISNSREE